MVQAMSFNRQQSINFGTKQSSGSCSVQVMVYVDPGIHVSGVAQGLTATEAVDDRGNSMLPVDKPSADVFHPMTYLIYPASVPLKYPEHAGSKIASLKFNVQLRASADVDQLTIENPLESKKQTKDFGDTKVTFLSLKPANQPDTYELQMAFISENTQTTNDLYSMAQASRLVDADGHAFSARVGSGSMGGAYSQCTIIYTVNRNNTQDNKAQPPSGPPAKWVVELPMKAKVIKVPVSFKDLPLP
jgi:hypothetical protein